MNLIKKKVSGARKYQIDPQAKEKVIARAKSIFSNPKVNTPQLNQLLEAIKRIEKSTGASLFDHAIARAFKSDTVLINVMKKLIPDLKRTEGSFTVGGGISVDYMSDEELKDATCEFIKKLGEDK